MCPICRGITLKPVVRGSACYAQNSYNDIITIIYQTFSPICNRWKSPMVVFHVCSVHECVLFYQMAAQFFYSHISEIVESTVPQDGSAEVVPIDRYLLKGEARRFSANWTLHLGCISPLHRLHHLLQSRRCEFCIQVNMSVKRLIESSAHLELAPVTTHRKLIRREGTYCSFGVLNKMLLSLSFINIPR